ncbi:unnamed protein product, partial [Polarella glacialis]
AGELVMSVPRSLCLEVPLLASRAAAATTTPPTTSKTAATTATTATATATAVTRTAPTTATAATTTATTTPTTPTTAVTTPTSSCLARAAGCVDGPRDASDLLGSEAGRCAASKLAAMLIVEQQLGSASLFAPYLALLPESAPPQPLTLPWPTTNMELSPLLSHEHKASCKLSDACLSLLEQEESLQTASITRKRWGLSSVLCRSFSLTNSASPTLAMVPLLDVLNHWTPKPYHAVPWTCHFEEHKDAVVMLADRDIQPGEELTHLYSASSDSKLLCRYGIAPAAPALNMFNEAVISVPSSLLSEPASNSAALAVAPELEAARTAAVKEHGWVDLSKPLLFLLPRDLRPQGALLALARLLALGSDEEVVRLKGQIFRRKDSEPGSTVDISNNNDDVNDGSDRSSSAPCSPQNEQRAWKLVAILVRQGLELLTTTAAAEKTATTTAATATATTATTAAKTTTTTPATAATTATATIITP